MGYFGGSVKVAPRAHVSQASNFAGLTHADQAKVLAGWTDEIRKAAGITGFEPLENIAMPAGVTSHAQVFAVLDEAVERLLSKLSSKGGGVSSAWIQSSTGNGWVPCGRGCHATDKWLVEAVKGTDEAMVVTREFEHPAGSGTTWKCVVQFEYRSIEYT